MVSHQQPQLIAIDKPPDDDVMQRDRSGKAHRLARLSVVLQGGLYVATSGVVSADVLSSPDLTPHAIRLVPRQSPWTGWRLRPGCLRALAPQTPPSSIHRDQPPRYLRACLPRRCPLRAGS